MAGSLATTAPATAGDAPSITAGIPAIDHHSHASMSPFRTVDQIERAFATAHLEANVPHEAYLAYIAARNAGDAVGLARLDADHGTEALMQAGLAFRSTTFFARSLKTGCRLLYGPQAGDAPGAPADDEALARVAHDWGARSTSFAYDRALEVAGTPLVLTDIPFVDRTAWSADHYLQICRIDPYLYPFHPGTAPGRGTEYQRFHGVFARVLAAELKHYGMQQPPAGFDDYLQFVEASVARRVGEGAVGLKIVSAYVRSIDFGPATAAEAAATYHALAQGEAIDGKPLQDFLVRRLAQYAADRGLPMQVHVGMGHPEPGMVVAHSAPLLLESFLNTPSLNRLKVVLLHGGYPYSSHVAALAQTYGNVFVDFSWMPYLHHYYLRTKLVEWLEILPANKLMYGSDTSAPEFHVAAAHYARGSLDHVLNDGHARGVWDAGQVEWLARRILFENTAEVYGIGSGLA